MGLAERNGDIQQKKALPEIIAQQQYAASILKPLLFAIGARQRLEEMRGTWRTGHVDIVPTLHPAPATEIEYGLSLSWRFKYVRLEPLLGKAGKSRMSRIAEHEASISVYLEMEKRHSANFWILNNQHQTSPGCRFEAKNPLAARDQLRGLLVNFLLTNPMPSREVEIAEAKRLGEKLPWYMKLFGYQTGDMF